MAKQSLVDALAARREALGLTHAQVAERSGLTERSVRNALGAQGNPRMTSLLALVDALELELHLAPLGFGPASGVEPDYQPVPTRVGVATGRS